MAKYRLTLVFENECEDRLHARQVLDMLENHLPLTPEDRRLIKVMRDRARDPGSLRERRRASGYVYSGFWKKGCRG